MLRYYEDEVRIMALRRERLPQHENKAYISSLVGEQRCTPPRFHKLDCVCLMECMEC
jgi:hypothetical protein